MGDLPNLSAQPPLSDAPDALLLEDLVASGVITPDDRSRVRKRWNDVGGGLFTDVLLRERVLTEVQLLRYLAAKYVTRFVPASKLRAATIDEGTLGKVPIRVAEALMVLPLWWDDEQETLSVIVAAPFNPSNLSELRRVAKARTLDFYVSTYTAVGAAIRRHYYADLDAFDAVGPDGAGPPPPRPVTRRPEPEQEITARIQPVEPEASERTRVLYASDLDMIATLRKENARFRIAQELHRRLPPRRDLESQLEAILELVFDLLAADVAVIRLASGQKAWRSRIPDADGNIPSSILAESLLATDGLLRNGIGLEGRSSESVVLRGVKSVLAMPLRSGDEVLGVVYLESRSAPAAFDENDRALLSAVAANAAAVIHNAKLMVQVQREAEVRTNLSRFLAPELVDRAVAGRLQLQMEGQAAIITVLYADIRGFTRATQVCGAGEVVQLLSRFYDEATQAVFDEGGMIDKFIGDCVMAVWNAPIPRPDHALRAVRAAQGMQRRVKALVFNGRPLEIGIGIATGEAIMGAIGSARRMDYTVIGNPVNLASRLCDSAGSGEIVVNDDTRMQSGEAITSVPLPPQPFKGIAGEVRVHRIVS